MPRLRPLHPNETSPEARQVLERFFEQRGNVPNMFRTFARRPEMMIAAANLMAAVLNTGTLPLRLKEMVIVRTSKLNGCAYCMTSHSAILRGLGVTQASIDALENPDDNQWTEQERTALRYAEAIAHDQHRIDDQLWETLHSLFDEGEIVELTAAITMFHMFNRFNDTLQMEITEPGWPSE